MRRIELATALENLYTKLPKAKLRDVPVGNLVMVDFSTIEDDAATDVAVFMITRQLVRTTTLESPDPEHWDTTPGPFKNTTEVAVVTTIT